MISQVALIPQFILFSVVGFFITSCSITKHYVYTSGIFPVFLDDSTAAVFLLDETETEKVLSSPFVSKVSLRGFKVDYKKNSKIVPFTPEINSGDLSYGPNFSLVGDLLFISTSGTRNPLIVINWKTGQIAENTKKICCASSVGDWLIPEMYLLRTDTNNFKLINLTQSTSSEVNLDTLFGIYSVQWFDMRYSQGNIGATFGRADSLWLVEKNLTGSGTKMFLLPIVPEILKNRGELEVRFGPNSDYLSLNTIGGGWIRHIIPLDSLRNNPTKVNWKRTGDEVLNRDLNLSV